MPDLKAAIGKLAVPDDPHAHVLGIGVRFVLRAVRELTADQLSTAASATSAYSRKNSFHTPM